MTVLGRFRSSSGKPPRLLAYRSSSWAIITTVSFAVFTDIFLYGVIVPVLPFAITVRAGVAEDKVQYWIAVLLAVYGAALMIGSPICGFLADRFSNRKIPMLAGLIALAGATVFLCVSKSIALFIVGRFLQGAASSVSWTVGLALIVDTVDRDSVGASMGWVGLSMSIAFLAAPLLGGIVYDKAGYYPVFAMCFGLLALDTILRLSIIEVKVAKRWQQEEDTTQFETDKVNRPQLPHNTEATSEKAQIAIPTAELSNIESSTPPAPLPTQQKRSKIPKIIQLLASPRLLSVCWGTLMHATVLTAIDTTLPLFVKQTFGWNSLGAGLAFLPFILPSFLGPLIGAATDRYGPKWFAAGGFLLAVPFLVCLRFVQENTIAHKVMLCGLLAGVGVAEALVYAPLMPEIMWMVEAEGETRFGVGYADVHGVYAQAYALYNMAFSAGAILGPIMGGFIRDAAGWGAVGWSLAVLSGFSAVPLAIWVGGPLWEKKGKEAKTKTESDAGSAGSGINSSECVGGEDSVVENRDGQIGSGKDEGDV